MKKTNKKGFTLVELLAVIVILAIILLIAVPNVLGIIDKARKDSFCRSAQLAYNSAELFKLQEDEVNNITGTGKKIAIVFEGNKVAVAKEANDDYTLVTDGWKKDFTTLENAEQINSGTIFISGGVNGIIEVKDTTPLVDKSGKFTITGLSRSGCTFKTN